MKKHKRRRFEGRTIKLYLGITLVCFIIAALLYFFMDKGGKLMDKFDKISDIEIDQETIEQLKKTYEGKIDQTKLNKIKKHGGQQKTVIDIDKALKTYGKKLDSADLEKLKKKYKDYQNQKP
ncbi:hypothetical protein ACFL9T_00950 [Thermodesulfobacteriota bacterium]